MHAHTAGNPGLKPEKAVNLEAGLQSLFPLLNGLELGVSWFDKDIVDLIQWVSDPVTWKSQPENISAAGISGVELTANVKMNSRLSFEANYNYLDTENRSDDANEKGKKLIYRPAHMLNLVPKVYYKKASLHFSVRYIDERFIDKENAQSLEANLLVDSGIALRPRIAGMNVDLLVSVKNIFDKDYQVVYGYPMPGRAWIVRFGLGM